MFCNICDTFFINKKTGVKLDTCCHDICIVCLNLYCKNLQCKLCKKFITNYNHFNLNIDVFFNIINMNKILPKLNNITFENIEYIFNYFNNNIITFNMFEKLIKQYLKSGNFPINYNKLYDLLLNSKFQPYEMYTILYVLHDLHIDILDITFLQLLFNKYKSMNVYYHITKMYSKKNNNKVYKFNYHDIIDTLFCIYNLDHCLNNNVVNIKLFLEHKKNLESCLIFIPEILVSFIVNNFKININELLTSNLTIDEYFIITRFFNIYYEDAFLIKKCIENNSYNIILELINQKKIIIDNNNIKYFIKYKVNSKVFDIVISKFNIDLYYILELCYKFNHILFYNYITSKYKLNYNSKHLMHLLKFNVLQYSILNNIIKHDKKILCKLPKSKIKIQVYSKQHNNIFKNLLN